jgi:succinylglutamate desuccinylase
MENGIVEIIGETEGNTSIILAGVHGNEVSGIKAFEQIIPTITIARGRVIFALGNLKAIKQNVRFTEANLNRLFKDNPSDVEKESYEYRRAQELKNYLDQSGALLDIHASNTPNSKPFIICENNADQIVQYLPTETIVHGFDQLEPGGTDYYMNKKGKIGIALECGYINDPKSVDVAVKNIVSFLSAAGHTDDAAKKSNHSYIQMERIYLSKTNKFILERPFDDFEIINKEQKIGLDGKEQIIAEEESVILFARNRDKIGEECFLMGRYNS